MLSAKEIVLATTTALSTAALAVSTALHFTPWPHGNCSGDTLRIPYTATALSTIDPHDVVYQWDRKELPRYVCIKDDPAKYPVTVDSERIALSPFMYKDKKGVSNRSQMHFLDGNAHKHYIILKLNSYPDKEIAQDD